MRTIKHHSTIINTEALRMIGWIGTQIGVSTKTIQGFKYCEKIYKNSLN